MAEAPAETQALDRDGAKDGANLGGMIAFATLQVAAIGTGTLRLQIRRHLLLHYDFLQGLEHGFAFGEGQTQRGGRQVLPLHTGDLPGFRLAFIGGDHDLDRILHGDTPSG